MYYTLLEPFTLRSYKDYPFMIMNQHTGDNVALNPFTFQTLLCCDGETEVGDLPEEVKEHLAQLEDSGFIRASNTPLSIKPYQGHVAFPNIFVRRTHWSITGRCNLRCRHCYLADVRDAHSEISKDKAFEIVQQIADAGITAIGLSGGEPLVRLDFLELVDEILSKGLRIEWIESNTLLITAELLDALLARGVKPLFCIGFDGVGWHDWLRGREGTEQEVIAKIGLLRSYGFTVYVETVFHRRSLPSLEETMQILAELGVFHWKVTHAEPSGAWCNEDPGLNLSLAEILDHHLLFAEKYLQAGSPMNLQFEEFGVFYKGGEYRSMSQGADTTEEEHLMRPACSVLRTRMYISPEAKLMPCMPFAGHVQTAGECPDLFETTISQALTASPYMERITLTLQDFFEHNEECRVCEHRKECRGGCRAGGAEETGDYLGIDSWICTYVKNGYEAKFRELSEKHKL